MRIMHFAGGGDIGGAKTHILSLVKELSATNEVRVVSFRPGEFSDGAVELGLDIITSPRNSLNVISDIKMALQAVDEFQPDIIHCHGARANMMGVLVKKLRKVPIMTTVHSDPKLDYLGMPLKQHTFGAINNLALRHMDFYMAVTAAMQDKLISRGFNPEQIFTVYNGLDFRSASAAPKPLKSADEPIVVGIAARLTAVKDIATVIKAFAKARQRNPRLRLAIAGTGEDEKELKALAKKLDIEPYVDFAGWVYDMHGFFAKVDINVLASLSETFPYSLLEGAYEHCAAISSDVGGISALIRHGENGYLFQPGDVDTFAEYIYRLSVDEELRQRLAENLFATARDNFSMEKMRADQEAVYARIIRRRSMTGRQGAVICGAYGRGNAGDEAILKAILLQMREIDPDMPLCVMSRNKVETRRLHHADSIYIFNVLAMLKKLRRAKIFINGGGSLIQDVTSSRSLYFYLFTLVAARMCGCRVIMYGCGIGPVQSERNSRLAVRVLNRNAEVITLRDSVSYDFLLENGVTRPRVILTADPTVNLPRISPQQLSAAFAREGMTVESKKIGICLRNWPSFHQHKEVAEAAAYAYERYGLEAVFLPMEVPNDISAAEATIAHMRTPYHQCRHRYNVEELISMLGSMEVVVGMRLHSLIFSTAGGAPVIGISYDIKVESFLKDIGSDACIQLAELSAERLKAEIDKVMSDGQRRGEAAAEFLRSNERINGRVARAFLNGEDI
ncbi:MAG: polysaccharide pyruvyl transferase CsaB [Firmicutes bacterium]|nr:polysaccharide pyruvyl transferase CsaB [Bacillota bacterium]